MNALAASAAPSVAAATGWRRGWRVAALALAALLLAAVAMLASRLPDGQALARQAEAEFERRFGIGVQIGSAAWHWRPVPELVLQDVRTRQPQPITIARIAAVPQWRLLWQRRVGLERLEVDEAHLPSASVRAFRDRDARADELPAGGHWRLAPLPVARLVFRDLRWMDRRGIELDYAGEIDFDAGWLPRAARVRRPEVSPATELRLTREAPPGDAPATARAAWQVQADAGGGQWQGRALLHEKEDGLLRLEADLPLRGVDVARLVAAFGRQPALEGRASGRTTVRAEGRRPGELLRSLRTRTEFQVAPATLLRFDLARAVRTLGRERAGHTTLDELRGTVLTQATGAGTRMGYRDLHARSGVLSAQGQLQVFNRRLQGRLAIDLVDGVVGVPLQLGGTLDAPQLGMSGGALAGAAAGSAVLPGVGTALGARLGQQLEDWFGEDEDEAGKGAPRKR